jgi:WD40 repeat protein
MTPEHLSLYPGRTCDTVDVFPRITTTILQVHTDEVWSLEWSHSGKFLASASRDKSVIVWSVGVSIFPNACQAECLWHFLIPRFQFYSQIQILTYPCTCIYETTNFPLRVLRGPSTILYCCRLARRLSRCGIRRFAVSHVHGSLDLYNSSVVWCPHSNDRGPCRTGLSTCLATRWIWIHFSFP